MKKESFIMLIIMELGKKRKKCTAFTLVELLVVIAILAILATVSVVGYLGFTKKANISNDISLITQMNTRLKAEEARSGKPATYTDMRKILLEDGIDIAILNTYTKGYEYAWYQKDNQLVLLNQDRSIVAPDEAIGTIPEEDQYLYWVSSSGIDTDWKVATANGYTGFNFSHYLKEGFTSISDELTTYAGLDTGYNGIKSVIYVDNFLEQKITIHTGSFMTKINLISKSGETVVGDTITHYGYSYLTDIPGGSQLKYIEHGTIGRLLARSGKITLSDKSELFAYMSLSETTSTMIDGGFLYKEGNKNEKGIATGVIDSCLTHDISKDTNIIHDYYHSYRVCKKCGYTIDNSGIAHTDEVSFKGVINGTYSSLSDIRNNLEEGKIIVERNGVYEIKDLIDKPDIYKADINALIYFTSSSDLALSEAIDKDVITLYESSTYQKTLSANKSLSMISENGSAYPEPDTVEGYQIKKADIENGYTYSSVMRVNGNFVAYIGDTGYESLQAAFNAASGKEVVLATDIGLSEAAVYTGNGDMILDLNGHIISYQGKLVGNYNEPKNYDGTLWFQNKSGTVTIKDTSLEQTGKVTSLVGSALKKSKSVYDSTPNSSLVIEGGIYIGALSSVYFNGGTLTLNGGSFQCTNETNQKKAVGVQTSGSGAATITYLTGAVNYAEGKSLVDTGNYLWAVK